MKIFCLFLTLFFNISLGLANQKNCLEISEKQLQEWLKIKPQPPALAFLIQAKKIIDDEKKISLNLGNDKTAHCYLGCRISEKTNYSTAHFVAWQKEYNDATDCDRNTHFEIEDFKATVYGAKIPTKSLNLPSCETECINQFPKNYNKALRQ